ncbi:MAG: hypothetical protein H6709_04915 [Kofleriaceae bacterium]|nr:hypothetical protein [Myxococcales bacterium]MCB9559801.1 hypothetical protein [Kofleriaceae bacterium]MCB9571412.1 hypothetical protein [Kofleriaceae bacterium]
MRKLALCLVVLAVAGAASCGRDHHRPAQVITDERDALAILEASPWLDRAPTHETDVIHLWAFARGEGVYFVGNAYKGSYEMLTYFVEGDELRVRFLDENKTYKTRFTLERTPADPVFDYKLTLAGSPRGPKVYFGFDARGRKGAVPAAAARARAMLGGD